MRSSGITPRRVWIAWSVLLATVLLGLGLWIVQGVVRGVPGPIISGAYVNGLLDAIIVAAYAVTGIALATIAAILISRVADNPIGWILGAVAAWQATTFFLIMSLYFLHSPNDSVTAFANWLGNWTFVISVPTSLVLMIFPTGALPSHRWRILPWLAILGIAGWATVEATSEVLGLGPTVSNPYANVELSNIANVVSSLLLVPALIGTVASLVVRYRRSSPHVRLQIKWVAFAGAFQILVWLLVWGLEAFQPQAFGDAAVAVGTLSGIIVPAALGVAILRFRLYEIDRLVSRTVTYSVVVGVLAAVYSAIAIGLPQVLPVSLNSPLVVAGATLAAAALFNPVRRRVQVWVDRRFNRARYDAQWEVDHLTDRLRAELTLDDLTGEALDVVTKTMQPSSVSAWIRRAQ